MNSAKGNAADFAVATLCHFLKATFGAQATDEALRQVPCRGIAHRDIADIWADVLQNLKRTP